jgi:hypothetical protein
VNHGDGEAIPWVPSGVGEVGGHCLEPTSASPT